MDIAVVGSGIAGLSAAWLLNQRHRVTLYESESRPGGHSNTVEVPTASGPVAVDTGFIVFNEHTYPNLTALFDHLDVPTQQSDMSFAVSLDHGQTEYAGTDAFGLFAQRRNLLRPRFWSMLNDLRRFYRDAPALSRRTAPSVSLGEFLTEHRYGAAFGEDHLLPMAAAIWSASAQRLQDYSAAHFIRFCENHGLLKFANRPIWRTVTGGSREYVSRLLNGIETRLGCGATAVWREGDCAAVRDATGSVRRYDQVVLACHADQALGLLEDPSDGETTLLSAFGYSLNRAVLHGDPRLMPRRRKAWASWNYIGRRDEPDRLHVTYWMNRLQELHGAPPLFLTLNPALEPTPESVRYEVVYRHPQFDAEAMRAQTGLWSLQGVRHTWFCGAYFGSGFHEDGLQAGLAVAEQLGDVRRPWTVPAESGRIHLAAPALEFA
ncbi:MAG: NAD(P)/FAD-dependent oxidoreductase [Rhodopila sp.]